MVDVKYFEELAETPFMSLDISILNIIGENAPSQIDLRDYISNSIGQAGRIYADTVEVIA